MQNLKPTRTLAVVFIGIGCISPVESRISMAAGADARVASTVAFTQQGNGITNTRKFRVPGEWKINYSFSHCHIPGFDIYVKGADDDMTSKQGSSGRGTQYEHSGGTVYLTINTACSWHVTVIPNGSGPKPRNPSVLLDVSDNGISNTMLFHAPNDWKINYTFSHCQIPGFDIYVKGDADDIMSKQGSSGHGVQYEHSGGTVYLTTNSACSWHIRATK